MEIKYLNSINSNEWNDFVKKSPQGSIFSKTWYLDALKVKYSILCVIDENESILAGIVLAKNQINTYSNPMLDKYLGVILKEEVNLTQKIISKQYKVLEFLAVELKQYKTFDYYFHPEFKNWIPFYWSNFTQQTRYTYRIDFNKDIEQIQKSFHGNVRNDIKNAIKNNIKIIIDVEFDSFYKIINKTFLRQGSKAPFDRDKLHKFIKELRKKDKFVSFAALNQENEIISVCGLVYDNNSSYFLLNGIDIDNQIRGANALMIFESIKYFHDKCQNYDFEGSMLPGVEQFYRRFGGELVPYMRIWNDNFFNYFKSSVKKTYKKLRYGR